MRKPNQIKLKILITLAVMAYALIMYWFKVPCMIFNLTGVKCLTCGMTRAVFSALRLDFSAAFSYHSMFWSLPILYLYFLFDGKLFTKKFLNILIIVIIVIGFVNNWLFSTII
ncbi:MAG: DUF2752 domain-containing protein [Ruminococcaceae bacterium]|nr:DUF2752 domain-containing protein [Oscillospiraceae bacterium]